MTLDGGHGVQVMGDRSSIGKERIIRNTGILTNERRKRSQRRNEKSGIYIISILYVHVVT